MPILENNRREIFAQNIARGITASEAYVIAGYKENQGNASNMQNEPEVVGRVKEIKLIAAAKAEITAERVLAELSRIGFAKVTDAVHVVDGKVQIIDTDKLSPDIAAALSEIRQTRDGVAVKFHDKRAALELMSKHLGLFKENIDLNVNVSLVDLVNGSYKLEAGELKSAAPSSNGNTRIIRAEPAGALIEHDPTERADNGPELSSEPVGTPAGQDSEPR